jgi:hypothetical protein
MALFQKDSKRPEAQAASNAAPAAAGTPAATREAEREPRRSARVTINIPVQVYGQNAERKIFREETSTSVVSGHGAVFTLNANVNKGQRLVMTNPKKGTEADCHVIYAKAAEMGRCEVAVEFDTPSPGFWGIAFPPPDWSNADRKRPSVTPRQAPTPTKK